MSIKVKSDDEANEIVVSLSGVPEEKEVSKEQREFKKQFSFFRKSKSRSMIFDDPNSEEVDGFSTNITFQERPAYKANFGLQREISHHNTMDHNEKGNHVEIYINRQHLISGDPFMVENCHAAKSILHMLTLRDKYMSEHAQYIGCIDRIYNRDNSPEPCIDYSEDFRLMPKMEGMTLSLDNGVYVPLNNGKPICEFVSMVEYLKDLTRVISECFNSSNKSFCYKRLEILEQKFELHLLYNREKELGEQKRLSFRDFFDVRKIDTHIHHSACMHVKTLLNFMIKKYEEEPNTPVILDKSGKPLTLKDVFVKHKIDIKQLNVDALDVQAGQETFQRFDRFNKKYNPFSQSELREIFMKTDNYIGGRFLAEVTQEVFNNYDQNKYEFSELRISVYGRSAKEWEKVSEWINKYKLYNHHARWLIQVPRLYEVYKKAGLIESFQNMIDNIFKPLFEVTLNPEINPGLYQFLLQVVGFDCVDDESIYEKTPSSSVFLTSPENWKVNDNPHYSYWAYYLWANLYTLNNLRKMRGLNTFGFRPHSGEAGSPDHMMAAYLLADGINHGIKLNKVPVLQYLYYLKQIGIAMSPLSNNKLFCKYKKNPFPRFFMRGLNVSLSTDDPLIFHLTHQALLEEYSIAAQVYNLSSTDMCEIARNSVLQSGFEPILKKYWIGENYDERDSPEANDPMKTNLPPIRYQYRLDTLREELKELKCYSEALDHQEKSSPTFPKKKDTM